MVPCYKIVSKQYSTTVHCGLSFPPSSPQGYKGEEFTIDVSKATSFAILDVQACEAARAM